MTALAWILAFHADSQPLVQRLPAQNHPVRCQEFDRIRKLTFCAKAPPGLAFMADRVPRGRFCPLPIVLPPAKNRATGDPERSFLAPETPRALPGANLALRPARLAGVFPVPRGSPCAGLPASLTAQNSSTLPTATISAPASRGFEPCPNSIPARKSATEPSANGSTTSTEALNPTRPTSPARTAKATSASSARTQSGIDRRSIENRLATLRWFASELGKANIVKRTNAEYLLPPPGKPNYIDHARKLDAGDLDKIRDPHTRVPW